jgi:hypothetical protein
LLAGAQAGNTGSLEDFKGIADTIFQRFTQQNSSDYTDISYQYLVDMHTLVQNVVRYA